MESIKTRFKDAVWAKKKHTVTIGGAGGIGSWLAFALARTEQNVELWDYDTIDQTNMSGQLYRLSDIGKHKTVACKDVVRQFSGTNFQFEAVNTKMTKYTLVQPFCFSAFDNMTARKEVFEAWYEQHKDNKNAIFIDGRMLMESGQIFCVTPSRAELYRKEYLFDEDQAPSVDCSSKATSHCGMFIASVMTSMFTNHLSNIVYDEDMRDVPFKFEFELPLINFTTDDK